MPEPRDELMETVTRELSALPPVREEAVQRILELAAQRRAAERATQEPPAEPPQRSRRRPGPRFWTGIAVAATGFVLGNFALLIAGTLVGASGAILTQLMCKAMNRSIFNVLFAGFGTGGMPVGLQIVGRSHDEATVMLVAGAFEAAQPEGYNVRPYAV